MKKLVMALLLSALLVLAVSAAKPDKEHQSNGKPFREIWDYLGDPDLWIESFSRFHRMS